MTANQAAETSASAEATALTRSERSFRPVGSYLTGLVGTGFLGRLSAFQVRPIIYGHKRRAHA
jgi:hypothetical protein